MGACVSCEAHGMETAKLIMLDGTLEEFSSPVKVWQILQKNPTSFVCNSDDMDFDDAVSAVSGNEDLKAGELYFLLPLTWLNHPLRAEEMAALAVKASSALAKSNGNGVWDCNDVNKAVKVKRNGCGGGGCGRGGCGGRKGKRKFKVELSTIME